MKFTITSITEAGVKAKEDNPITQPAITASPYDYNSFIDNLNWQEAEANRREYDIKEEQHGMIFCDQSTQVGDRIEGEIKNDQIVNLKII